MKKKFVIEQYEIHVQKHEVEAATADEAIKKFLKGEDTTEVGLPVYVEVADDRYQPLNQYLSDEEFAKLNGDFNEDYGIDSIKSIKEKSPNWIALNREADLYFKDELGRVVFFPKGWCDDFKNDNDDDPAMYGWNGQESTKNWKSRPTKESFTYEAQNWVYLTQIDKMERIDSVTARQVDPELFELLDAINAGIVQ